MVLMLTIGLLACLLIGLPVSMSLGLSALGAFLVSGTPVQWTILSQKMQVALQNYVLLAIPLFILAAKLMNTAGISQRIFRFADTLVGFLPGGLGHANILGSLIFSGMSGAAVVDAAGLGQIEVEAMTDAGYPPKFAVACTASSSIIGPIFPPSIPIVVFSFVSGVSVGKLFLGGIVPGLIMTAVLMGWVAYQAKKHNYPRQPFPTLAIAASSFAVAVIPLMTPVILLGGIWMGIFTPTEAAGVASLYALVVGVFVFRELTLKDLVKAFIETARETAIIGFLVATSAFYGWVLMRTGLTLELAKWIIAFSQSTWVILLIINCFLLVIGCFMDSTVAILILGPIFMPVLAATGIDPVHFGVLMVLNLMIGLMTPPFGMILFVMQQISGLTFEEVVVACIPTLVPLFVVLLSITFFPLIVTWLPNLIM